MPLLWVATKKNAKEALSLVCSISSYFGEEWYIFVTLHVYLYSEPLLLEHKEVVVDMISRSFAEKGDLTTLANVTYDNIAEQVSSTLQMYLFCLYF